MESLRGAVRRYAARGLRLRIVLVDSGPRFSLGDFTTRAWRRLGAGPSEVLIVTTPAGLHAHAPWYTYARARQLARSLHERFAADPVSALVLLSDRILAEAERRSRHRRIMVWVAVLAGAGWVGVFGAALLRRRRRRGADATA